MVLKGKLYFLIIYLFLLSSCISKNENRETGNSSVASELVKEDYEDNEIECQDVDFEDATQDFPDGSYCAEVQYENPKDRKSTRLNSSHLKLSRMPSSA